MKIGISAQIQFSLFSSGSGVTSLAIAEAFRNIGHEVWLVNTQSDTEWWDDCPSLKGIWGSFLCRLSDLPGNREPFDLFLEVDRLFFSSAEERKRIAKKNVWILRKSILLHDIQASLFPFDTGKRCLDGVDAIWSFDLNSTEDDLQYIECLTRIPASFVPFTWTPSAVEIYRAETKAPSWEMVSGKEDPNTPWKIHICETNNLSLIHI